MALAVEAQLDPVVDEALARGAGRPSPSSVSRSTVPCSRTPARTRFSTYSRLRSSRTTRLDALAREQMGQHQAGRARAHDPDLGPQAALTFHALSSLASLALPNPRSPVNSPPQLRPRPVRRRSARTAASARSSRPPPRRVPAQSDQAAAKCSCSASSPTSRGPPAAPAKRPRHHHAHRPRRSIGTPGDDRQRQRARPRPADAADEQRGQDDQRPARPTISSR